MESISTSFQRAIEYDRKQYSNELLLQLYTAIRRPRMIEEKMLVLLRQGRISKWFSGIGQEAISVGDGMAMHPDEYILPMHRNLGIFTSRNIPLDRLFKQGSRGQAGRLYQRQGSFFSFRHTGV